MTKSTILTHLSWHPPTLHSKICKQIAIPAGKVQHAMCDKRTADCFRFAIPAEAIGGLEAWRFGGLEAWIKEEGKMSRKRRTNRSHYGVLTRFQLEHRTHYRKITLFYNQKLLKRRSDCDCSSTIVLKRHSDFKFIKIFIKFDQNWGPGRPKSRSRGVLGGLRHLKAAKPTPGKRPGRSPGIQNGSHGAPGIPKAPKM